MRDTDAKHITNRLKLIDIKLTKSKKISAIRLIYPSHQNKVVSIIKKYTFLNIILQYLEKSEVNRLCGTFKLLFRRASTYIRKLNMYVIFFVSHIRLTTSQT